MADDLGGVHTPDTEEAVPTASPPSDRESNEITEAQLKRKGSPLDDKPAKKLKTDSEAQIVEQAEGWAQKDGDLVFNKTKIIIRHNDAMFSATSDKRGPELEALDIETLERIPIPPEDICPEFKEGLTKVSLPLSNDIYVKTPTFLTWEPQLDCNVADLVLQEAEVCEILKKHPHPNIAQYHGCLVEDGRITGLCFKKYKQNLEEALNGRKDITEAEMSAYYKAIETGIRHLHKLGMAHNDINPYNVMVDDDDNPVIIDFDSSVPIGDKLGAKGGTFQWGLEGAEFSEPENDFYGLKKIQEEVFQVKLGEK